MYEAVSNGRWKKMEAKSVERQQAIRLSVHLSACRPGPLLPTLVFYTTLCFIILHSAFCFCFSNLTVFHIHM